ncbi:tetratricopeptide repeat protein [Acidobacteria bacterium AB60]|nr:tetratricopeptide repeat protein [Acidobacteria bacterium AB60]
MAARVLAILLTLGLSSLATAQLPPLGGSQDPKPAPGLPPLGALADQKPGPKSPGSALSVDTANADLIQARVANQEKRYADAETLMLHDTALRPHMPYLWLELGQAQLGQKKYPEAEASFNSALAGGESSAPKQAPAAFYQEGKGTVAHVAVSSAAPSKGIDTHEVQGSAYSGLGEIYVRLNKIPEAKEAFDKAAAANPASAGFYYRNEAIVFLQTGHAPEQVEAADKAIAADPTRGSLYFFKGQGLAAQSSIDPKTQKLVMPPGCADALQKYLQLEPTGPYAADAKGMLAAAGIAPKPAAK